MKKIENRTMSAVLEELNNSVDKYNETEDAMEKVQLAARHRELVAEYNEASLLNAYAGFMNSDNPIIALAKAYYYPVVSVKDNVHNEADPETKVVKSVVARSVNESDKKLDVVSFIKWTEECNKSVAANKTWEAKIGVARNSIENEWKKFFASNKDSHSMSIGKAKKALQSMFDALVFIPCENDTDKNAIIANGDIAKWVLGYANDRKDTKVDGNITITGAVLSKAKWKTLLMDILHKAVTGKTFEIVYGEPEKEVAKKVEAEADEKTEA
jgi:hypothetical protein